MNCSLSSLPLSVSNLPTWSAAWSTALSGSVLWMVQRLISPGEADVKRYLSHLAMDGTTRPMAQLIYGAGLRLMEFITLRVKDIDCDQRRAMVHGKGDKDRTTLLPASPPGAKAASAGADAPSAAAVHKPQRSARGHGARRWPRLPGPVDREKENTVPSSETCRRLDLPTAITILRGCRAWWRRAVTGAVGSSGGRLSAERLQPLPARLAGAARPPECAGRRTWRARRRRAGVL